MFEYHTTTQQTMPTSNSIDANPGRVLFETK